MSKAPPRTWTADEIDFLMRNYLTMTDAAIGKHLGRSDECVRARRDKIGARRETAARVPANLPDMSGNRSCPHCGGEGVSVFRGAPRPGSGKRELCRVNGKKLRCETCRTVFIADAASPNREQIEAAVNFLRRERKMPPMEREWPETKPGADQLTMWENVA